MGTSTRRGSAAPRRRLIIAATAAATFAACLALGGCGKLAALDDTSDGSAVAAPGVDAGSDSSLDPGVDPSIDDGGPANPAADALAPSGLTVDGVPCTTPTSQLAAMTGSDGRTWSFTLHSTCGAVGSVDVTVTSKDAVVTNGAWTKGSRCTSSAKTASLTRRPAETTRTSR